MCIERLDSQRQSLCIISGKRGIGKTSLCLEILSKYANQGYDGYIVERPSDLTKLGIGIENSIVFIDDTMCQSTFKAEKLRQMEEYLRHIGNISSSGSLKVLITVSDDILVCARDAFKTMPFLSSEENIINLTQWKMRVGEKRNMFLQIQA